MVVQKADQVRIKTLLTEAISNLCRDGLNFKSEFCVEGLLGITLDNDDIFLINIKETITSDRIGISAAAERELCDLTIPSSLTCGVSDASLLMGGNTTLDFSKTGFLYDKADRQDAFQLNALDLNIASGYGNADFEMLFDLSTPGRKRDLLPMDMSTSFLGQDSDVDHLIAKDHNPKVENLSDDLSEESQSDLILIKEEGRFQMDSNATVTMKPESPFMSLDLSAAAHTAEAILLNLKVDEQLTAAALDTTDLEAVPLNLSEPPDPQPQDLSTNQSNKQVMFCIQAYIKITQSCLRASVWIKML